MLDKLKTQARKELEAEAKRKAAEELKEKKAAEREDAKEARKRERIRVKTAAAKAPGAAVVVPVVNLSGPPWGEQGAAALQAMQRAG